MATADPPPKGPTGLPIEHDDGSAGPPKSPSTMRQTADAVVAAFNAMDIDGIVAHRAPDCMREFLPRAMGYPPQDNATYARSLRELKHIFRNFSLVVDDIVEETEARKMSLCLQAGADTLIGRYENDYVWMWEFDDEGIKVKRSREFSDSNMSKIFYPKLKEAMRKRVKDSSEAQEDDIQKSDAVEPQERQNIGDRHSGGGIIGKSGRDEGRSVDEGPEREPVGKRE